MNPSCVGFVTNKYQDPVKNPNSVNHCWLKSKFEDQHRKVDNDKIMYIKPEPILKKSPGSLTQIDASNNIVCGVNLNTGNEVFCADNNNPKNPNWKKSLVL
jgi:hypothetical protein